METKACVVVTSIDSEETARNLAFLAIEEKLAACAQIISGVESIYSWRGELKRSQEFLIQFKTSSYQVVELMRLLGDKHPYDTPEIISINIDKIDVKYLKWLESAKNQDIPL